MQFLFCWYCCQPQNGSLNGSLEQACVHQKVIEILSGTVANSFTVSAAMLTRVMLTNGDPLVIDAYVRHVLLLFRPDKGNRFSSYKVFSYLIYSFRWIIIFFLIFKTIYIGYIRSSCVGISAHLSLYSHIRERPWLDFGRFLRFLLLGWHFFHQSIPVDPDSIGLQVCFHWRNSTPSYKNNSILTLPPR